MSKLSNIMSEKIPPQIEKPRSELQIEQQANFEGSWTNLMIERLRSPEIRKQVVDLMCEQQQSVINDAKKYIHERIGKPKATGEDPWGYVRNAYYAEEFVPITREDYEERLTNRLEMVEKDTPISFNKDEPNAGGGPNGREIINLGWKNPKSGEKLNINQWNIVESHEKGHMVRRYGNQYFAEKFWKAFDFSQVEFTEQDVEDYKKSHNDQITEMTNTDEIKNVFINYLKNPMELAERMSQLKNYFGLAGQDRFTKEHLIYARKHYINDTDFDNGMTQFFQAITPEKEDAFIELINSAGI
jgi:hypothetical protein